jgi:hypothetical protein
MRETIDLGITTPSNEECAQVGSRTYDYYARARKEGRALINQLRRMLGPELPGAALQIKSHPHDFGDYLTIVCTYDVEDPIAAAYAERCDVKCLEEWDEEARTELGIKE